MVCHCHCLYIDTPGKLADPIALLPSKQLQCIDTFLGRCCVSGHDAGWAGPYDFRSHRIGQSKNMFLNIEFAVIWLEWFAGDRRPLLSVTPMHLLQTLLNRSITSIKTDADTILSESTAHQRGSGWRLWSVCHHCGSLGAAHRWWFPPTEAGACEVGNSHRLFTSQQE